MNKKNMSYFVFFDGRNDRVKGKKLLLGQRFQSGGMQACKGAEGMEARAGSRIRNLKNRL